MTPTPPSAPPALAGHSSQPHRQALSHVQHRGLMLPAGRLCAQNHVHVLLWVWLFHSTFIREVHPRCHVRLYF